MKAMFCGLLAMVILGSCANKFSLQKRKYNKGFYFAGTHKSHSEASHKAEKSATVKINPKENAETEIAALVLKEEQIPTDSKPSKKQIRLIEKNYRKNIHQKNEVTEQAKTSGAAYTKASPPKIKNSRSIDIGGLGIGVMIGVGGVLGIVLALIYLLQFYTIGQALILIGIFILIGALLGGGAYVGFGF